MRYACIACEAKTDDPSGWNLSGERVRKVELGLCPTCRKDTDVTGRRIWDNGDLQPGGLTKALMMKRLREARKQTGCCPACGQPKPAQGPMGRRPKAQIAT